MAKLVEDNKYECSYCHKKYHLMGLALGCEKDHKLVYVPIPRDELLRFVQFLYTGDFKLISQDFIKRITTYARMKDDSSTDLPDIQ